MSNIINKKNRVFLIGLVLGLFFYLLFSVIYSTSSILAVSIVDSSYEAKILSEDNPYYIQILCMAQMMFNIPLVGFFIYILKDNIIDDFKRFKNSRMKNILFVFLGLISCYILSAVVAYIYEILGVSGVSDNQDTINLALNSSAKIPMIISVVIFAPIVEEILFRKLLFGTLEENFKFPSVVVIIISTLVFSLIHVAGGGNLIYIFQYIPLAFVITFSYYISNRNIFVPMGIHFLNNLISVIAVYLVL